MKLSTKGRYGLRAMVDLAAHSGGEHVPLNSIAERQDVSENYLEQVFSILRKAGLVKSLKGAQGGYVLTERPENIRVGTILRALEGDLSIVEDATQTPANSIEHCIKTNVWDKVNACINELVDSITLEDLVHTYKRLQGDQGLMFYI